MQPQTVSSIFRLRLFIWTFGGIFRRTIWEVPGRVFFSGPLVGQRSERTGRPQRAGNTGKAQQPVPISKEALLSLCQVRLYQRVRWQGKGDGECGVGELSRDCRQVQLPGGGKSGRIGGVKAEHPVWIAVVQLFSFNKEAYGNGTINTINILMNGKSRTAVI